MGRHVNSCYLRSAKMCQRGTCGDSAVMSGWQQPEGYTSAELLGTNMCHGKIFTVHLADRRFVAPPAYQR